MLILTSALSNSKLRVKFTRKPSRVNFLLLPAAIRTKKLGSGHVIRMFPLPGGILILILMTYFLIFMVFTYPVNFLKSFL